MRKNCALSEWNDGLVMAQRDLLRQKLRDMKSGINSYGEKQKYNLDVIKDFENRLNEVNEELKRRNISASNRIIKDKKAVNIPDMAREVDNATHMLNKGYDYMLLLENGVPLYTETEQQAADLLQEEMPKESGSIMKTEDFIEQYKRSAKRIEGSISLESLIEHFEKGVEGLNRSKYVLMNWDDYFMNLEKQTPKDPIIESIHPKVEDAWSTMHHFIDETVPAIRDYLQSQEVKEVEEEVEEETEKPFPKTESKKAQNQTKPVLDKIEIEILPDESPDTSYLEPGGIGEARHRDYTRGKFGFIGIKAKATILVQTGNNSNITQHISSGGLWGIEDDAGEAYFKEVAIQELIDLGGILAIMNVDISNWDELAQEAIEAM